MQIKNIMSEIVIAVSPDTPLKDVAANMQQQGCGFILVAENDRLVGVITDSDIALHCVTEGFDIANTTVEQIMSPEILYCRDTDTPEDVTKSMNDNNVRRLAVLDADKRLVGMVTLDDLSKHLNSEKNTPAAQKYHYVARKPVRAAAQKLMKEASAVTDGSDPVRLAEKRISDCRAAANKAETQFWREVLIDLMWLEQTRLEDQSIEDDH